MALSKYLQPRNHVNKLSFFWDKLYHESKYDTEFVRKMKQYWLKSIATARCRSQASSAPISPRDEVSSLQHHTPGQCCLSCLQPTTVHAVA
jgi:hypothetical protein